MLGGWKTLYTQNKSFSVDISEEESQDC